MKRGQLIFRHQHLTVRIIAQTTTAVSARFALTLELDVPAFSYDIDVTFDHFRTRNPRMSVEYRRVTEETERRQLTLCCA